MLLEYIYFCNILKLNQTTLMKLYCLFLKNNVFFQMCTYIF